MTEPKHGWNAFRPYRPGDLGHVWGNLREDDLRELSSGGLSSPEQIELMLLTMKARLRTWETEKGPVSVFGVTPTDDPDVGLVWGIAAEAAMLRWRFFVRNTPAMFDDLGEGFKLLMNFKDSRNINQIKWLKKVGFVFINSHTGADGPTYLEFVRIIK